MRIRDAVNLGDAETILCTLVYFYFNIFQFPVIFYSPFWKKLGGNAKKEVTGLCRLSSVVLYTSTIIVGEYEQSNFRHLFRP